MNNLNVHFFSWGEKVLRSVWNGRRDPKGSFLTQANLSRVASFIPDCKEYIKEKEMGLNNVQGFFMLINVRGLWPGRKEV